MTKETTIGNAIRLEIKNQYLTNMFVIRKMQDAGFEMNEVKFSNKLGGIRDKFLKNEVKQINNILKTDFSVD